ncbi:hypothetical protein [Amycolatopsis sp. NPDC051903]|uniref:hypothetical protein n=1 Tax=Amycolatopsis sp. NPDC051903 TaxID=3363936 RepID=UPI00379BE634
MTQVEDLEAEPRDEPGAPGHDEAAVLDALPTLAAAPPDLLRTLFEVLRLEVRLLDDDHVDIGITLPAREVPAVAQVTERITDEMTDAQAASAHERAESWVDVVCAPGEIRTHTGRVLNPRRKQPLTCMAWGRSAAWTAHRPRPAQRAGVALGHVHAGLESLGS